MYLWHSSQTSPSADSRYGLLCLGLNMHFSLDFITALLNLFNCLVLGYALSLDFLMTALGQLLPWNNGALVAGEHISRSPYA